MFPFNPHANIDLEDILQQTAWRQNWGSKWGGQLSRECHSGMKLWEYNKALPEMRRNDIKEGLKYKLKEDWVIRLDPGAIFLYNKKSGLILEVNQKYLVYMKRLMSGGIIKPETDEEKMLIYHLSFTVF